MSDLEPGNSYELGKTGLPITEASSTGTGANLLAERNAELDAEVKATLERRLAEGQAEVLPQTSDYFMARLDARLEAVIAESGYDAELATIAPPTKRNSVTEGTDLALNATTMARQAGHAPVDAANTLVDSLTQVTDIAHVDKVGPFVNIELDFSVVGPRILEDVATYKDKYGYFRDGDPELVVIDYSSPNVAKNMTVAHLRSTIIGHSLAKIQRAAGNIPFTINHIGDWGTQFGGIIYEYRREMELHPQEFSTELEADPTKTLMRIYRAFNERQDPSAVQSAQDIFLQLEQGDPESVELWTDFRKWSLRDFGPIYERLRIEFDAIQGESFYEDRMMPVIEEALEAGVLKVNNEGAVVFPSQTLTDPLTGVENDKVMLDHNGQPRDEVVLKPSGGTVYLTRDLAAIRYRRQELGADRILYVIGKEQQTHCLELFTIAHQLGYMALGRAEHISFGHLNIDGRKMKSRSGKVALLNDMLDDSIDTAGQMLDQRIEEQGSNVEMTDEEKAEILRKIGISTLVFNDLKQDRRRDIAFEPDMVKTLEAGRATYIQYTDARISRLLEKVGDPGELITMPTNLSNEERAIIIDMARLPQVIAEAAHFNAPHKIAGYLTEFCQNVNTFYRDRPIARADTDVERVFRLHLMRAAKQIIGNSADLLHLELPGKM